MRQETPVDVRVALQGVTQRFGRRIVFSDISADVRSGQAIVVTGPNGSGKSTLLKIVAGLLTPSRGSADIFAGAHRLDSAARRRIIGYVAPDLALYGELTAAENLWFFARIRGITLSRDDVIALLERVGLKGRGRDYVREYSSGMRQRLKYAYALLHRPPILLLDEPTANLDAQGAGIVESLIEEQKRRGLVVIATNEASEVEWGDAVVRLDDAQG